ncbi:MAG: hypothetical protein ACRD0K_24015 [Egibacteraceae bacterium]
MALTIVYVHGNGNKVREDLLKQQWDEALFGRDMGVSSRMAYWAPLRYPQPLPDPASDETTEELPQASLQEEPSSAAQTSEEFITEVAIEVQSEFASVAPLELGTLAGAEPLEAWLRDMTYTADALAEGEDAEPPLSALVLPLPRPLRIAAFRALVQRTFVDVYAYLFGGLGQPMRDVVHRAVSGIDGPVIVLGHSLGSIIAYDALRARRSAALDVPLLVTVGSPLGVTEVQDLVEQPLHVPAAAAAWRNVSDARDLVALDHTLRPEYAPPDRCTDFLVRNDSANHHGIREYLSSAPVQQPILDLFQTG